MASSFLVVAACSGYSRRQRDDWRGEQGRGHRRVCQNQASPRKQWGGTLSRGTKYSDIYFRKVTLGCEVENTLERQD